MGIALHDLVGCIRLKHGWPGIGALVCRGMPDAVITEVAVRGQAFQGGPTIADSARWHVGSNFKAMLATVAARLVERGLLSWDRPAYADFANTEIVHPSHMTVTLRHLLKHTAGVPAFTDEADWARLTAAQPRPAASPSDSLARFVRKLLAIPVEYEPGSEHRYSNAGYAVAARMMELATGRPWQSLVSAELFEVLGMKSAGFGAPNRIDPAEPWGHRAGSAIAPSDSATIPTELAAAGDVHMSLADYGSFLRLHLYYNGMGDSARYLAPASMSELHAPWVDGGPFAFAAGWGVVRGPDGSRYRVHSGSDETFFIMALIDPVRRLAVAIVTNCGGAEVERAMVLELNALLAWARSG